jgi:hypothetical protein
MANLPSFFSVSDAQSPASFPACGCTLEAGHGWLPPLAQRSE